VCKLPPELAGADGLHDVSQVKVRLKIFEITIILTPVRFGSLEAQRSQRKK
jgi:hypothetical protein